MYTKTTTTETAKEIKSVAQLKERLTEWDQDVFKMERRARRVLRQHTTAAPMVAAFLHEVFARSFWTKDPQGWFYGSVPEWEEEYGFTRANVDTAVKVLEDALGIIETRTGGIGNRTHYRLLPARLIEALYPENDEPSSDGSLCGKPADSLRETSKAPAGNQQTQNIENHKSPKSVAADAAAHTQGKRFPENGEAQHDLDDSGADGAPRQDGDEEQVMCGLADALVGEIEKVLRDEAGFGLSKRQRKTYERQARDLLDAYGFPKGEEVRRMGSRIAERWPRWAAMDLEAALQDVRAERSASRASLRGMRTEPKVDYRDYGPGVEVVVSEKVKERRAERESLRGMRRG